MLVHAASGVMVSAYVLSRSTPSTSMRRSSPRAANTCSFSSRYRGFSDSASSVTSGCRSVGSTPTMIRCAPTAAARSSA